MLLARAGYRVAIVDRARFPSDTLSTHNLWQAESIQLKRWGLLEKLEKWRRGLEPELRSFSGDQQTELQALVDKIEALCAPRRVQYSHHDFTRQEVQDLLVATSNAHSAFGGTASDMIPSDVDAPRPFEGTSLLHGVEAAAEMLNVSEHVETLLVRMRALLTDTRMRPIIGSAADTTLEQWLTDYIGSDNGEGGCVSVIDLSLVPTEVVHVVTAVIARMVFEALQRVAKVIVFASDLECASAPLQIADTRPHHRWKREDRLELLLHPGPQGACNHLVQVIAVPAPCSLSEHE